LLLLLLWLLLLLLLLLLLFVFCCSMSKHQLHLPATPPARQNPELCRNSASPVP
jgi:hypothetical protein